MFKGKVVIVGASNVGSAVLTKLLDFQLASEIALIDINEKNVKVKHLMLLMQHLVFTALILELIVVITPTVKMLV